MAKYGTFKYGLNQKYGTQTIGSAAIVIDTRREEFQTINIEIPGTFSISRALDFVEDTQSISATYNPENIQNANHQLPDSRASFNNSEIQTSGIASTITLVQTIGNPIVINNAGARFAR